MQATTPCPKPDQFSTNDLMQVVTYRAELWVTHKLSEEMVEFAKRLGTAYSETARENAFLMFKGSSTIWY